jgi:hypothetical protein
MRAVQCMSIYPKGQVSGMVATPENKTASLTTSAVRKVPKRTFAIHVSDSEFVGCLFMLDQLAFRPFVRFVRRKNGPGILWGLKKQSPATRERAFRRRPWGAWGRRDARASILSNQPATTDSVPSNSSSLKPSFVHFSSL